MSSSPLIRKIVFPAAGLGTRVLPATAVLPKELLPIVDKPIIQYGMEEAVISGLTKIILVHSAGNTMIKDHFSRHSKLEEQLEQRGKSALLDDLRDVVARIELSLVPQAKPLGLGHAVMVSRKLVDNEPFAVLLSDDVIDADPPALKQMLAIFAEVNGPVLLVERVSHDVVDRYGIIDGELVGPGLYRVTDLVEKPTPDDSPSNLAIIGRYLLTPDVYPALLEARQGSGGEIQLTDALAAMLDKIPLHGLRIDGRRFDCGTKSGFIEANAAFAAERADLGGAG